MFQGSYKGVNIVLRKIEVCFKEIQRYAKELSRVLQGSFKCVSRKLQDIFTMIFQERFLAVFGEAFRVFHGKKVYKKKVQSVFQ